MLVFLALLNAWGACPDCEDGPADFDGGCEVGVGDFLLLPANWEQKGDCRLDTRRLC